jgi:opacity protein-like surface antigen
MSKKRLLAVATCAAAVMGIGANAALAGEVTGSGANEQQNQGMSWCSFSGLNDDPNAPLLPPSPTNPDGPGGQSQSYGQNVKLGLDDPHVFNPGEACNPNRSDFGPQPNRDK